MSFMYGWDPTRQVCVREGIAFLPLLSPKGSFEVAVKPDIGGKRFINDFAAAEGPDEFLKRLSRPWFTKHQYLITDENAVYCASRADLEDAESALQQ